MDKYLNDYISKDNNLELVIDNKKDAYYTIYRNLTGVATYKENADTNRINKIYDKAVKDKLIDKNNPLKLIAK